MDEIQAFVDEHLDWVEVGGHRACWFEGNCDLCDWETSGLEKVVEAAAWEHAREHLAEAA